MSRKERQVVLWSFLIAAATLVVYAGVWSFDFVQIDDPTYVIRNPEITDGLTWSGIRWAFSTGYAANWHPLTWLSHMADVSLFGLRPGPAHAVNLVLHVANALLLFWLLASMTGAAGRSAVVALFFAIHPLHVESVAWISERKDVLSTAFWILTTIAYVAWVRRPARGRYALMAMLFALGLMAKPMLVTLPFTLLLLDVWPLKRVARRRTLIVEKLPLFALAAASSIATYVVQHGGGAVMALGTLPVLARVENAVVSYVRYVVKMFWPTDLLMYYPPHSSWPLWQVLGCATILGGVTAATIRLQRTYPYAGVGWLWYLGTLVPVIGLVQVGRQSMADRYTYVPLIGLFVVVVWGAHDLAARWPARRWLLPLLTAIALAACAVETRAQVRYWQNDQALWTHAIGVTLDLEERRSSLVVSDLLSENALLELQALLETHVGSVRPPAPAMARLHVGRRFLRHQQLEEGVITLSEAVQLDPTLAEAHSDLGLALSRQGRLDEAVAAYGEALRLNPDLAETHNDLGFVLAQQGKLAEAMTHFADAVRLRPTLVDAWRNLGLALANLGRFDDAATAMKEVLKLNPDDANVRQALAEVEKRRGKLPGGGRS